MGKSKNGKGRRLTTVQIFAIAGCIIVLVGLVASVLWWRVPVLEIKGDRAQVQTLTLGDEQLFVLAWSEMDSDGKQSIKHVSIQARDGTFSLLNDANTCCLPFSIDSNRIDLELSRQAEPTLIYDGGQVVLANWFNEGDVLIIYRTVPAILMLGRG